MQPRQRRHVICHNLLLQFPSQWPPLPLPPPWPVWPTPRTTSPPCASSWPTLVSGGVAGAPPARHYVRPAHAQQPPASHPADCPQAVPCPANCPAGKGFVCCCTSVRFTQGKGSSGKRKRVRAPLPCLRCACRQLAAPTHACSAYITQHMQARSHARTRCPGPLRAASASGGSRHLRPNRPLTNLVPFASVLFAPAAL